MTGLKVISLCEKRQKKVNEKAFKEMTFIDMVNLADRSPKAFHKMFEAWKLSVPPVNKMREYKISVMFFLQGMVLFSQKGSPRFKLQVEKFRRDQIADDRTKHVGYEWNLDLDDCNIPRIREDL